MGKSYLKPLLKVLSDPSSKLFGGLEDTFPYLMNGQSQVSDFGPSVLILSVLHEKLDFCICSK